MTFDYDKASLDDLDERSVQLLIFDDKELFPILKGHLIVERILDTLIDRNLKHPNRLRTNRRLTFELKLDLARALGVIPEYYVSPITALNKIRNQIAHVEGHEVTVAELKRLRLKWEPIQQKAFAVACAKGVGDAATIATLFLVWKCLHLIATAEE
jgi:hypothetical protein